MLVHPPDQHFAILKRNLLRFVNKGCIIHPIIYRLAPKARHQTIKPALSPLESQGAFLFPDADTQPTEPTTISGKPITSPVAFRLVLADYQKLQERAGLEGKTVAALVQEWVLEKLAETPTARTQASEKTAAAAARGA